MEITLKQLEAFVCVADCGSFYEAALRLYVSQPTVSSHIASLEKRLNVQLLERGSRRKVVLTEAGREIYDRAGEILQRCRELENEPAGGGELRLGASSIPMGYLLPPILAVFQKELPGCRLVLKEGDSTAIHGMLTAGTVQLGLVGTVLDPERLSYRRLCSDELLLVTPNTPEYRALREQNVLGKTLLSRPLIVRSAGSGTQLAVEAFLSEQGLDPKTLQSVARVEGNERLLELTAQGFGNTVLSSLAARAWEAAGRVLCFPLDAVPVTRDLYLAWPKQTSLSRPARRFAALAEGITAQEQQRS